MEAFWLQSTGPRSNFFMYFLGGRCDRTGKVLGFWWLIVAFSDSLGGEWESAVSMATSVKAPDT